MIRIGPAGSDFRYSVGFRSRSGIGPSNALHQFIDSFAVQSDHRRLPLALAAWDEPAQSHEEADAALTLAADELRNIGNSGMVLAMVKAASGWLSSEEPQRLAA